MLKKTALFSHDGFPKLQSKFNFNWLYIQEENHFFSVCFFASSLFCKRFNRTVDKIGLKMTDFCTFRSHFLHQKLAAGGNFWLKYATIG